MTDEEYNIIMRNMENPDSRIIGGREVDPPLKYPFYVLLAR